MTSGGFRLSIDSKPGFRSPLGAHITGHRYAFGEFIVDPARNRVSRGDDVSTLEPKAMDVLVYLLERPGEVVTVAELLDHVWAGRVVEETTVYQTHLKTASGLW